MASEAPNLLLIVWTVALIAFVVMVVLAAYRWARLGAGEALSPLLRAGLLACLITIVWGIPGVVAGGVVALVVVWRTLVSRHSLPPGRST